MTPDQMKSALAVALAFLIASCAALAAFLYDSNKAAEKTQADRLVLARDGLVQFIDNNGWAKTKAMLLQQATWSNGERPHVWLLVKGSNQTVDDEGAALPVMLALRALSRPDKSVEVEGRPVKSRLHVAEIELADSRLLIGLVAPAANSAFAQIIYAVLWSSLAGMLGAFAMVYWASRRSNSRIDEIKRTIGAFLSGDMTKRVVFPGSVDSLYELAHGVNRVLRQSETRAQNLNFLASDIAHNLKKPLTRLRIRLEAARDADDLAPRYRAHADRAARNVDNIIKVFNAQLNVSQFQAGSGRSRFKNVDLRALTEHIILTYESIIVDGGKTLRTALPDKVPYVRGDAGLIMEMVVNIIENSIQHCPSGTTISISTVASNDEVSIVLSDDGPGVPAEAMEAVLQRFKRLDMTRPGHGIGLPFVVAVSELHNAMLELADNDPGLKVTMSFPIDFSTLTPQLGLRMRSGLKLKLRSEQGETSDRISRTLQNL